MSDRVLVVITLFHQLSERESKSERESERGKEKKRESLGEE